MKSKFTEASFSALVQDFFLRRLTMEKNASVQTIATYRDTFRLLFEYLRTVNKKEPSSLNLEDLHYQVILDFLKYLEKERGNSARSRNNRLAAIRSFMKYIVTREPAAIGIVQQVLSIPMKSYNREVLGFLTKEEINSILKCLDQASWNEHRDHVMVTTFYNTGARVSEIINLVIADLLWDQAAIRIKGKGRKERHLPLWKATSDGIKKWLKRIDGSTDSSLFPNRNGVPLSRSGVEYRLKLAVKKAQLLCPSLKDKKVSPHTLRHTTAMHLLQSGVDISVIALWLGHEHITTTHLYMEADLTMKEKALSHLQSPEITNVHYRPDDQLLAFLQGL